MTLIKGDTSVYSLGSQSQGIHQLTSELLRLYVLWSFQKVAASTGVGVWTEWEKYDLYTSHFVNLSEPSNVSIANVFRSCLLIVMDIWIFCLQAAEPHLEMGADWGFRPLWDVTLLKAVGYPWYGKYTSKSSFDQIAEASYPYISLTGKYSLKHEPNSVREYGQLWKNMISSKLNLKNVLRLTLDSLSPSLLLSPSFSGRQKRENWYG